MIQYNIKQISTLLIFLISILFFGCNTAETNKLDPQEISATIQYKQIEGIDPNRLSLDIYYTSLIENKKPVVIWVHGGGWCLGDKANKIENKVKLFRSLNYVFVSINYRLSPSPVELDNPERIMYPAHNEDVADAVKWVFNNISKYGGNSNKIALLGHSAGAHLVALTGTNSEFLNDSGLDFSNIKGIASIDTEAYNVAAKVDSGNEIYINAFGHDNSLNNQASPIHNIVSGTAYPRFFVAKRGNAERIEVADNFINKLEQNGVLVSQVDGSIYNHSGINEAIGKPGEELITNKLKLFFEECFK